MAKSKMKQAHEALVASIQASSTPGLQRTLDALNTGGAKEQPPEWVQNFIHDSGMPEKGAVNSVIRNIGNVMKQREEKTENEFLQAFANEDLPPIDDVRQQVGKSESGKDMPGAGRPSSGQDNAPAQPD